MRSRGAVCTAADHEHMSKGSREAWMAGTVPLFTGKRPIQEELGLEFADCRACLMRSGKRRTFTRRVMCIECGAPVDGQDYCSTECEQLDNAPAAAVHP
jgi:hypothetical protein